jgi:hypothetical protein
MASFVDTVSVPTLKWTQVIIILALSFGLLFVFSAFGLIRAMISIFPNVGSIPLGNNINVPVSATFAVLLMAFLATLAAIGINEGIESGKATGRGAGGSIWSFIIILAIISAAIWIIFPQLLPRELQFVAGNAQSLFTGHFPTQALLAP